MGDYNRQNYGLNEGNPPYVCKKCGAVLNDGQKFCMQCGTEREEQKTNFCRRCGAQLIDGQEFCHQCGQKVELAVESNVISKINQYNSAIEKKQKKSMKVPIIVGVAVGLLLGLIFLITSLVSARNAEVAKEEYLEDMIEFASLSYDAVSNLEDIADTVQGYWYDCIFETYDYDIDAAIADALDDKDDEIVDAKDYDLELEKLYSKIKRVPDEISADDEDDIEEIKDGAKKMYETYCEYYILATEPYGSYNTYSEDNETISSRFVTDIEELCDLLDL